MEKTPGQRIALTKFERSICSRERLAEFSIFHSFGFFSWNCRQLTSSRHFAGKKSREMYGKLKSDWTELSLKNWSFRDQLLTRVLTAKQFTSGSAKSEESRTRRVKMPVWQIFPRTKAKYYSITAQIESGAFLTKINPYRFDIKSLRTVKMTQKLTMYIKKFPETRRAPIRDVLTCYLLHPSVLTNVFRSKWKKVTHLQNISRNGTISLI